MKRLRGTAFDPFGYTAERRLERHLIGWYEAVLDRIIAASGRTESSTLLALAAAPLDIRGFGPVKEKAVREVKARVDQMLSRLAP
jgi:indolepyruvate ferredoxin oxidoreductase